MAYLCCAVSKLGQDFGSVVWDDAHGVTGQVEFLQTGQGADVPDLLQLETHTHTHKRQKMRSEKDWTAESLQLQLIRTNYIDRFVCSLI